MLLNTLVEMRRRDPPRFAQTLPMPLRLVRSGCATLAAASVLLCVVATARAAELTACRGRDMLAEMQANDPDTYEQLQAEAVKVVNTEALLWKIEKRWVAPSYLIGTVHLSDDRLAELSPHVMQAIADARRMAFEVADLSFEAFNAATGKSANLFVYSDGRTLDKTIGPELFGKAREALVKAGMPGEISSTIKPWLAFMLLSLPDCERKRTQSGARVFDMRLAAEGRMRGLPIIGLETLESQIKAMAAIPEAQQVGMLKAVVTYLDRTDDLMETMLQIYLKRQMGFAVPFQREMAHRAGVDWSAFAAFENEIVANRNAVMLKGVLPLLEAGSAFIGVGALHLVGKDGLVEKLRHAGYTVTPVE